MCIDMLDRLGKDYECDGRTDGRTDGPLLTIAQSTDPR